MARFYGVISTPTTPKFLGPDRCVTSTCYRLVCLHVLLTSRRGWCPISCSSLTLTRQNWYGTPQRTVRLSYRRRRIGSGSAWSALPRQFVIWASTLTLTSPGELTLLIPSPPALQRYVDCKASDVPFHGPFTGRWSRR
jgi:hypothetical protein